MNIESEFGERRSADLEHIDWLKTAVCFDDK
jgi:hypothetical protein